MSSFLNLSNFLHYTLVYFISSYFSHTDITCTRRDYSGDIGAVFKKKPGPIEDAFIVFNTTYSSFAMGRIHNTTELIDLKVLNETIVSKYLEE